MLRKGELKLRMIREAALNKAHKTKVIPVDRSSCESIIGCLVKSKAEADVDKSQQWWPGGGGRILEDDLKRKDVNLFNDSIRVELTSENYFPDMSDSHCYVLLVWISCLGCLPRFDYALADQEPVWVDRSL